MSLLQPKKLLKILGFILGFNFVFILMFSFTSSAGATWGEPVNYGTLSRAAIQSARFGSQGYGKIRITFNGGDYDRYTRIQLDGNTDIFDGDIGFITIGYPWHMLGEAGWEVWVLGRKVFDVNTSDRSSALGTFIFIVEATPEELRIYTERGGLGLIYSGPPHTLSGTISGQGHQGTVEGFTEEPLQVVIFDGHMHSKYSDEGITTWNRDIGEMREDLLKTFAYDPARIGFAVTDHSDVVTKIPFARLRSLFTAQDWNDRAKDISELKRPFLVIPGEEVTVGKEGGGAATHGHFLVYGLTAKLPYPFTFPEWMPPLESDPKHPGDLLLPESVWEGIPPRKDVKTILEEVKDGGYFGYIAHPSGGIGRKDHWTDYAWKQTAPFIGKTVKGIEILSGGSDHSVQYGG